LTGFADDSAPLDQARFVLLPVPYEKTTTFRKGTARGPEALLLASHQIELFDEEVRRSPLDPGVAVCGSVSTDGMPDALAPLLENAVGAHMDAGRIPGCLGGEHSISLGPIRAAAARHPGLGVLQVDAHPDLRDSYEGTRFGHGCVMRRVLEAEDVASLVQVGLRSVSHEDDEVIRADPRVRPYYACDLLRRERDAWVGEIVAMLPDSIYLTFDVDGLDPAVMPGTGTPEPGGLAWWDALALLRAVLERKRLLGFDVVELVPGDDASAFTAARLVMKILAYAGGRD